MNLSPLPPRPRVYFILFNSPPPLPIQVVAEVDSFHFLLWAPLYNKSTCIYTDWTSLWPWVDPASAESIVHASLSSFMNQQTAEAVTYIHRSHTPLPFHQPTDCWSCNLHPSFTHISPLSSTNRLLKLLPTVHRSRTHLPFHQPTDCWSCYLSSIVHAPISPFINQQTAEAVTYLHRSHNPLPFHQPTGCWSCDVSEDVILFAAVAASSRECNLIKQLTVKSSRCK